MLLCILTNTRAAGHGPVSDCRSTVQLSLHEGFSPGLPPPSPDSLLTLTSDFDTDSASFNSLHILSATNRSVLCYAAVKCQDRGNMLSSDICGGVTLVSSIIWPCRGSAAVALAAPSLSPQLDPTYSSPDVLPLVQLHSGHAARSPEGSAQMLPSNAATLYCEQALQSCFNSQNIGRHVSLVQLETSSPLEHSPSSTALLLASDSSQSADSPNESHVTDHERDFADSSRDTPSYGTASASPDAQASPVLVNSPLVKAVGLKPLQKAPKGNSVKQYHKLSSMQGVMFYECLEVTDEYGNQHCFDVQDNAQGALVSFLCCLRPCLHLLGYDLIVHRLADWVSHCSLHLNVTEAEVACFANCWKPCTSN